MQFVSDGPDIPDGLLQAHEEGRVVFFCGAGISIPAGLPNFKGLVDRIYQLLGTILNQVERQAYERSQFDVALDLLERRIPGQRIAVRNALRDALEPDLTLDGATDTHDALLRLARDRDGALRLVTTNFDRVFEHVAQRGDQPWNPYSAPMLPVPKRARWNGLVYLHGLLPDVPDESTLNRLVVTSGDFGLAYLTERWAARFVSELFRNYVVCFVGYRINDPVLRYMLDALAADRMLGEFAPQAYALGDSTPGEQELTTIEWNTKSVTPILYDVPEGSDDHSALHRTLQAWAESYRDGVLGKERIVIQYALSRPSASTRQDDFVGRMLWALSDESGLPAKRFAEHNPAPPLDWLPALADERFRYSDLARFGFSPGASDDPKLRFSLVHRPTPLNHAPWMILLNSGGNSGWDRVMGEIAGWLTRHLDDPTLIHWLSERGSQPHPLFSALIESKLEYLVKLESEGNTNELDEIRANAPNAVPGSIMRILWRLLLTGRVKRQVNDVDLYNWKKHFNRDGLTASLRIELRELLAPMIRLRKPFEWGDEAKAQGIPEHVGQIADWELVLAADHVHATIQNWSNERWHDALSALFDDFQQLLRDALGLLRELGEADDRRDGSHWVLPSITPHWQNQGFRDWVALIELLRDAWLDVREAQPARATRLARGWFELPYPTFKRLAFFAASQDNCIVSREWVAWLLADGAWWLWSVETQREVMRLLALQGHHLTTSQNQLEAAILAGPPREMYRDDLEPDRWQGLVERSVWLRLAKLDASGLELGNAARDRIDNLSAANPAWRLLSHEREEFSHWMSGTGYPDYEESRHVDIAPRKRRELAAWLRKPPKEKRPFREDTWRDTCRTRFFLSLFALCDLAQEGNWPEDRWREALQAWSDEGRVRRSWHYAAPLVQTMPDDVLRETAHAVAWWLESASKSPGRHEDILMSLCRRVLELVVTPVSGATQNSESIREPVTEAINHPVGLVTRALLNLWFAREPNDDDRLPPDIEPIFAWLCDAQVDVFRHGRVLLASRLVALFRVDRTWTERHLMPLFRWKDNLEEAKALWEGFLWSPRIFPPLLLAFKPRVIETASHYDELGDHKRQFAAFLTFAALERIDGYTPIEFQAAFGVLPQQGLEDAATALEQALDSAGEQREDHWKNRIEPFWRDIWPKSLALASSALADSLARMSISAGKEFPSALNAIHGWLQPLEHPDYVVHRLWESDHCSSFPDEALRLLSTILHDQPWVPSDLDHCLESIVQASPELRQNHEYRRLIEYARRKNR